MLGNDMQREIKASGHASARHDRAIFDEDAVVMHIGAWRNRAQLVDVRVVGRTLLTAQ